MGIGYISRKCSQCGELTLQLHGISVKATVWFECTICGKYEAEKKGK